MGNSDTTVAAKSFVFPFWEIAINFHPLSFYTYRYASCTHRETLAHT
jgi:hypothetical protein